MHKDSLKSNEENPFTDKRIAEKWILSVENDTEGSRENELYPLLNSWINEIQPHIVVEIGSGQGICGGKIKNRDITYVGIEPSTYLVSRAKELFESKNRIFIVGNAYRLPLRDEFSDAAFSSNVWMHLEDLHSASGELARILKSGGHFMIITANPHLYAVWEQWFSDEAHIDDRKIVGPVSVPAGVVLDKNIIIKHTENEITNELTSAGLHVTDKFTFGYGKNSRGDGIFICIRGLKL